MVRRSCPGYFCSSHFSKILLMNLITPVKRTLRRGIDFLIYARNEFYLFFRKRVKEQHQLTSVTATDRYPELFTEIRTAVSEKKDLSILSFGCSTGEECFSLQSYFPNAKTTGVDINKANLRKANRKNKYPNVQFLFSTPETIAQHGKYDVIFCMSVLCRWVETKDLQNCGHIYHFSKFSETVSMLADQVKSNGLLVVYNSNFRFEDTEAFKGFDILPTPSVLDSGFVHKYDSQNNRITSIHRHCVYRKRP
jgi:hypothetical protein